MARYPVHGVVVDGSGAVVLSALVSVYEYNAVSPESPVVSATVYAAQSGGVGVGSVTSSGENGSYVFWVDDGDYGGDQVFTMEVSRGGVGVGSNVLTRYHFSVPGLPVSVVISDFTDSQHDHGDAVGGGSTLNSVTLVTPVIGSFVNAQHNHGDAANGGVTLSSPTIVTPTIASFVNAGHNHSNAAGGGSTLSGSTLVTPVIADFTNAVHDHQDDAGGGVLAGAGVPYIRLYDAKAASTAGGNFTSGAWQKRTVTEDQDTGNNCSVAASVVTLEAGTYDCLIRCPAFAVTEHQARLRNTSDGVTTLVGSNGYASASPGNCIDSIIQGRFTIAVQKTFEIQHRCTTTRNTDGFGRANNYGESEIYTVGEFWKVA